MSINFILLLVMGTLYATGIYMLLERTLTRVVLGFLLITNASNLLLLIVAGEPGLAPIVQDGVPDDAYTDPLPQALTLTAIVIGFATSSFLLGMVYRSWKLVRRDEVQVDTEDVRVAEQPTFDPEDDAELQEESSEFLGPEQDPNIDYERATALKPTTGNLKVRRTRDGNVKVTKSTEDEQSGAGDMGPAAQGPDGDHPVGALDHRRHDAEEDERPGGPRLPSRSTPVHGAGAGASAGRDADGGAGDGTGAESGADDRADGGADGGADDRTGARAGSHGGWPTDRVGFQRDGENRAGHDARADGDADGSGEAGGSGEPGEPRDTGDAATAPDSLSAAASADVGTDPETGPGTFPDRLAEQDEDTLEAPDKGTIDPFERPEGPDEEEPR